MKEVPREVLNVHEGLCFNGVSRKFSGCFKEVLKWIPVKPIINVGTEDKKGRFNGVLSGF